MRAQTQTPSGTILRLVERQDQRTRNVLRALAAGADRGEVRGVLVCYLSADGVERFASTGKYRASREAAVNATARLQHRLVQAQEDEASAS